MLILQRRIGESVCIGDEVKVEVLGVKGNHIKIGIKAPKSVPIRREELEPMPCEMDVEEDGER